MRLYKRGVGGEFGEEQGEGCVQAAVGGAMGFAVGFAVGGGRWVRSRGGVGLAFQPAFK